jgi:hypothetical protein
MAISRRPPSHAPRVSDSATGAAVRRNTSRSTSGPSRVLAWVIAPAVGALHAASQQPHAESDPVTFAATSS